MTDDGDDRDGADDRGSEHDHGHGRRSDGDKDDDPQARDDAGEGGDRRGDERPPRGSDTTATLLTRARAGDEHARNELFARYLPRFQRWAHGRLPRYARDLYQTDDLVQTTLIAALNKLETFVPEREGAFLSYLRKILTNQIRSEIRRIKRRPMKAELPEELEEKKRSPLDHAIDEETYERYERALGTLPEPVQEAIMMRLELGFSFPEIADAFGDTNANAVRMRVSRGLVQIWEEMNGNA